MVKACLKNKRQAQKELYDRFSYMMKGVCLRYSKNEQEAEDLLQESFITAFEKLKQYNNKGALGGWLRKITFNKAIEHYRKNKNKQNTVLIIETDLTIDTSAIEQLDLEDLLEKIQQLPIGYRTVFNLYAVDGYKHQDISKILNISVGTSKSQYSRARQMLIKMIEKNNMILSMYGNK